MSRFAVHSTIVVGDCPCRLSAHGLQDEPTTVGSFIVHDINAPTDIRTSCGCHNARGATQKLMVQMARRVAVIESCLHVTKVIQSLMSYSGNQERPNSFWCTTLLHPACLWSRKTATKERYVRVIFFSIYHRADPS